jgi:Macrocin-O-methyltransferase (TylF)
MNDRSLSMLDPASRTEKDNSYDEGMSSYLGTSMGAEMDKLRSFTKYVPRQSLSLFLAKHELFKLAEPVHGHIIECGVFLGAGLMTWANFSAIYEPYNHIRRVVGFDTFAGFPDLSAKDAIGSTIYSKPQGLAADSFDDITECIRLYDLNRPIGHIPRVELVKGDASATIPAYVTKNQHLVVAMLYLDFDIYEPTKVAIDSFLPRMPKGSIIAFDELNQLAWPGETLAALEAIGLRNLRLRRFPTTPALSYAVLE